MWTQLPREKGHTYPTQFLAHVYCGQMTGWMKTPLGTEVDFGPGHIVLDGVPAPAKGAQQPPLFSAHVYCGHGRPSQLLLSSCLANVRELTFTFAKSYRPSVCRLSLSSVCRLTSVSLVRPTQAVQIFGNIAFRTAAIR